MDQRGAQTGSKVGGATRPPARRGTRAIAVLVLLATLSVAALGACSGSTGSTAAPATGSIPADTTSTTGAPPPRPTPADPMRVETVGDVVGEPGQPLEICPAASFSQPPTCAGVVLAGIEDADVPGLQVWSPSAALGDPSLTPTSSTPNGSSLRATTSRVHVIGDWDGTALTPTEPITVWSDERAPDLPTAPMPCPEPEGGWGTVGDRNPLGGTVPGGPSSPDDIQALVASEPDFAGLWVSPAVRTDQGYDTSGQFPIVAFTGDLDRHEAAIRGVYDGPLCVTSARFTADELTAAGLAISQDRDRMTAAGVGFLSSGTDVSENRLTVEVLFADREAVAWFVDQHPAGMVAVEGWLRPVTDR